MNRDLGLKVTMASTAAHEAVIEAINATPGWTVHKSRNKDEARGFAGIVIAYERRRGQLPTAIELMPATLDGPDTVRVALGVDVRAR